MKVRSTKRNSDGPLELNLVRKNNPLEKEIEAKVCKYAVQCGVAHRKYTTPQRRGAPDRILYPGSGAVFFIEFKRRGEKPTHNQLIEHAFLTERGFRVYVVDSINQGKSIIDFEAF
jgi:hypothetical protein